MHRSKASGDRGRRKDKVDGDRHSPALPHPLPHCRSSSSLPPDWIRSTCSSSFFFFSYLLVLIQLYCKNWRSGLITVLRTVRLNHGSNGPCFFGIDRFLSLKNRDCERFTVFSVGPYDPVRVSKPCFLMEKLSR